MSRLSLGLVLVLVLAVAGSAQLAGNYTIDPAGSGPSNFTTFSAAISALNSGVTAPVVFKVASTTFQETLALTPVSGVSSVNTVTFLAVGTPAIIDANGAQDAITLADLCDYFVFDNLKIVNFTRHGIFLNGQSSSNKGVNQCRFQNLLVETTGTSSTVRCLNVTQSDSNVFYKCIFRGGYYVLYNSQGDKNTYDTCEFDAKDTGAYAAYFINNNDSDNIVQNCFIHSVRNSTSAVCLQLQTSSSGNMIWNNTIICNTAGAAIKTSSGSWANSCSIRNNIVVNLGTGIINQYWFWNTGTPPQNTITPTVVDHNCYYCPNNQNYLQIRLFPYTTIVPPAPFNGGNLQAFQTWANTPANNVIRAGGAATYDVGSIEADPALMSMTRPFDIHLKSASPCLDAGTSKFPEAYQTISQTLAVAADFEGQLRGSLVDIGADEISVSIVGSGSPTPGGTVTLTLSSPSDAGLVYQCASSFGPGPIALGNRTLGLTLDALMIGSIDGSLAVLFPGYAGNLDAKGTATAGIKLPKIAALRGVRIYSAFLVLKAGAPLGIQTISGTYMFAVQ